MAFGVSSTPFLLVTSISHLFDNVTLEYENLDNKLKISFEADNCVTGEENVIAHDKFIMQTKQVMSIEVVSV